MNVIFVLLLIFAACFMSFAKGPASVLPTCRIKNGKKSLIVNTTDVAAWAKKGWKVADGPTPEPAAADDDDENDSVAMVNACKSHAELDALIEENGLEIEEGLTIPEKKAAILEAIE